MKRLRHRLGHWLLRDEPKPELKVHITADTAAMDIRQALLKLKRERGGSLGLS